MKVARVIYQELGIGAVAITDRDKLLAFIGIGDDHHLPGTPIASVHSHRAIDNNEVVYADGNQLSYCCSINPACKLGSTLVIQLRGENQRVIGTIKLYEPKSQLFSTINRTLGEGIASLLSAQIMAGQYERHKQLLAQSEIAAACAGQSAFPVQCPEYPGGGDPPRWRARLRSGAVPLDLLS